MNDWKCLECGYSNVDCLIPTRKVECRNCGAVYYIRALHIDGSPMLSLVKGGEKREGHKN